MTLIVANRTKNAVAIVADTKLTYVHDALNPYTDGVAKIIFINDLTAVAFAGSVHDAKQGIASLGNIQDTEQIVSLLRKATSSSEFDASFLIATVSPKPTIFRVVDGVSEELASAWIGDFEGFELYQKYFTAAADPNCEYAELKRLQIIRMPEGGDDSIAKIYSRMFTAMSAVIDSQSVDSVGGFVIPAFVQDGKFKFGSYCSIFRRPLDFTELNGTVPFGNSSTGTFSVNAAGSGLDHFAVHIDQGKIGIIFSRSEDSIMTPELVSNVDEIDFASLIRNRFSGSLAVTMHHNSGNYFQKAEDHFRQLRFADALQFLDEGIRISSRQWKGENKPEVNYSSLAKCLEVEGPPLSIREDEGKNLRYAFYMRGVCRFASANFERALQDFRESNTLDGNFYHSMIWASRTLNQLGQLDEAIATAKKCCEMHEQHDAFYICGQLLLEANQPETATVYIQRSQQLAAKTSAQL